MTNSSVNKFLPKLVIVSQVFKGVLVTFTTATVVWSRPFIYGMECHENARALDTPICTEAAATTAASCIQNVFQQKKSKKMKEEKNRQFFRPTTLLFDAVWNCHIAKEKRFYVLSYT